MYEIELRALVDDIDALRDKLDAITKTSPTGIKEVTVFFFNPHKPDFDLRLKLQEHFYRLSYKDGQDKVAREEIDMNISDPRTLFTILKKTGLHIRIIVARMNYHYNYKNFHILVNRVYHWGDAVEVEIMQQNSSEAQTIQKNIRKFIQSNLGISTILSTEELLSMNKHYSNKFNFDRVAMDDLVKFVNSDQETINFPRK